MTTDPTQPLPQAQALPTTPDSTGPAATTTPPADPATEPVTEPSEPTATPHAWTPPEPPAPREVSTSVRTSTIVWGAILVVAGIVLASAAAGFSLDVGLVAIVALAGAGVALLVGALTSSVRKNRNSASR